MTVRKQPTTKTEANDLKNVVEDPAAPGADAATPNIQDENEGITQAGSASTNSRNGSDTEIIVQCLNELKPYLKKCDLTLNNSKTTNSANNTLLIDYESPEGKTVRDLVNALDKMILSQPITDTKPAKKTPNTYVHFSIQ